MMYTSSVSETIRNAYFNFGTVQSFFPPSPAGNYNFGTTFIQKTNFPYAEPDA